MHPGYELKRALCNHATLQELLFYAAVLLESVPFRSRDHQNHSVARFPNGVGLPRIPLRFVVPHHQRRCGYNGLSFDFIDFSEQAIHSWRVPLPRARETNSLFKRHIDHYKPGYLRFRLPFMGLSTPHCSHISRDGYLCASNGFYCYVINTRSHEASVFPADYLVAEPMHYSKQGNFSSDGRYWYFVRWPMSGWADLIDKRADSIPCQVGRLSLDDRKEQILLTLPYQEEVHEVACSPDDKYLVFCTFKQDLRVPYPKRSFFRAPADFRASHEAGIKLQQMVTVELSSLRYWLTELPAPVVGHFVFDPDEPGVVYVSGHNAVFHQLSAFLEGPAALVRLRIADGKTVVEGRFTDDGLFRIFQHEVFRFGNRTFLAVMSYPNHLYILNVKDMRLHKKIRVGQDVETDFTGSGNSLCHGDSGIYYTVNASEDGKYLVIGSAKNFVMFDMAREELVPLDAVLPTGFGIGSGIPHTRTWGN
jgi:hypothetical protein